MTKLKDSYAFVFSTRGQVLAPIPKAISRFLERGMRFQPEVDDHGIYLRVLGKDEKPPVEVPSWAPHTLANENA